MKPRFAKQQTRTLTKIEVVVIVAVLTVLAALLLPPLPAAKRKPVRINCGVNSVCNIKPTGVATNRLAMP